MSKKWQLIEKEDFGTDWAPVRFGAYTMTRFENKQDAVKSAVDYVTDRNCNNALAAAEKKQAAECFLMTEAGCFMGVLNGEDWYLRYPKDIMDPKFNDKGGHDVLHNKGDIINDTKWFELEGKSQVAVRTLPGT